MAVDLVWNAILAGFASDDEDGNSDAGTPDSISDGERGAEAVTIDVTNKVVEPAR